MKAKKEVLLRENIVIGDVQCKVSRTPLCSLQHGCVNPETKPIQRSSQHCQWLHRSQTFRHQDLALTMLMWWNCTQKYPGHGSLYHFKIDEMNNGAARWVL